MVSRCVNFGIRAPDGRPASRHVSTRLEEPDVYRGRIVLLGQNDLSTDRGVSLYRIGIVSTVERLQFCVWCTCNPFALNGDNLRVQRPRILKRWSVWSWKADKRALERAPRRESERPSHQAHLLLESFTP